MASPAVRIDAHAHQIPASFLADVEALGFSYPLPGISPEQHLAFMDEIGCGLSVISLPPPGPHLGGPRETMVLARSANDAFARIVDDHPGRFAALAAVPLPTVSDALAETERALDVLALDGVALYSSLGGRYVGDAGLDPLFALLDDRGAHVLLHPSEAEAVPLPGYPPWLYDLPFETTRAVVSLLFGGHLTRFPRIRWQLSHAGGTVPFLAHRLATLPVREPARASPAEAEIVPALQRLYYDTAQADNAPALAAAVELAGAERLVFGTDWPYAVLGAPPDPQPGLVALGAARFGVEGPNALRMAAGLAARLERREPPDYS